MSLVGIVVVLVVVGAVLAMVPMDSRIRTAVVIIVLLAAAFWLLNASGVLRTHAF